MIFAADTVGVLTILGVVTGLLTGVGGLIVTLRRDSNTNVQGAIDLALTGSGGLIKNLQDEMKRCSDKANNCEAKCDQFEAELEAAHEIIRTLQQRIEAFEDEKSNWEASEIAYKLKLGELGDDVGRGDGRPT